MQGYFDILLIIMYYTYTYPKHLLNAIILYQHQEITYHSTTLTLPLLIVLRWTLLVLSMLLILLILLLLLVLLVLLLLLLLLLLLFVLSLLVLLLVLSLVLLLFHVVIGLSCL